MAGMLALSSPGVRVARAGDGDAASGAVAGRRPERRRSRSLQGRRRAQAPADRSAVSAQIAERIRAEMQSSGEKPIVLNGRGYNYRTVAGPAARAQDPRSRGRTSARAGPSDR